MRLVCWSSIACVLLVPACKRADTNPSPTPSASASSSPAAEILPSPPVGAWETARTIALGTAAKPPAVVFRAPATSPGCAVPSVARRLDAKHDAQRVELDKQLKATAKDRVAALSKAWEPFMLGDAFRRTQVNRAGLLGIALGPKLPKTTLLEPPIVGMEAPLESPDADGDSGFAAAIRKTGGSRFRCTVSDVVSLRASELAPIPGAMPGQGAELLLCDGVGLVLPRAAGRPRVKALGEKARVEGFDPLPDSAAPELRQALQSGSWDGATIEVAGAARLRRFAGSSDVFASGDSARAHLSAWGVGPGGLAIPPTWLVSFDTACAAGIECEPRDGLEPAKVLLLKPGKPRRAATPAAIASASPSAVAEPPVSSAVPASESAPVEELDSGRWENAARAVDPPIAKGAGKRAWSEGFFVDSPEGSKAVEGIRKPGDEVTISERAAEKEPTAAEWRKQIAATGGVTSFRCGVVDITVTRAYSAPAVEAAGKALGFDTSEGTVLAIRCNGGADSFRGAIVVVVPTHAARAVIGGTAVKELVAPEGAFFDPALGPNLLDTPRGAELVIARPPRLLRNGMMERAFGLEGPVWIADFTQFRCAHEGIGCELFDGLKLPAVKPASKALAKCEVSSFVYPPKGYTSAPEDPKGTPLPQPPAPEKKERPNDHAMMVRIPAGAFVMGGEEPQPNSRMPRPAHLVFLSEFWIDETEVTTAKFMDCVHAKVCMRGGSVNPGTDRYCHTGTPEQAALPMNCVARLQAETYCKWVGAELPTEAQWEKAARGIDARAYPWGNVPGPNCAVAAVDRDCGPKGPLEVAARPAGQSPYGALGMSGGVWEWVADTVGPYPALGVVRDPVNRNPKGNGVLRGGGWGQGDLTAYAHLEFYAGNGTEGTGFRCARAAAP